MTDADLEDYVIGVLYRYRNSMAQAIADANEIIAKIRAAERERRVVVLDDIADAHNEPSAGECGMG